MRISVNALIALVFAGIAGARAPGKPKLDLRGDRFRGLTSEELTPEQKSWRIARWLAAARSEP